MGVRHKCRAKDCEREARARHLCIKHYAQIRRYGRLHSSNRRDICLVIGCGAQHIARGYCQKHYRQLMRTGKIINTQEVVKNTCFIATCQKKKCARGLCNTHHRYYLFKYVRQGSSWEKVDQIIAELNQNFLAVRNRVEIIKARHKLLVATRERALAEDFKKDQEEEILFGDTFSLASVGESETDDPPEEDEGSSDLLDRIS